MNYKEDDDKINLSVSGENDLNKELADKSEGTKSTSEILMSTPASMNTSTMGNNDDDEHYEKGKNQEVSDMHSRMNPERDAEDEVNDSPSERQSTLTKSDVPYDVPNDQTPTMSDMPNNIEKMTKKSGYDESK